MSLPADLLAQARRLANSDPGRPQQAAVRRAVSTAYYALFHSIGEESAKLLIGTTHQDKPRRDLARRTIPHTRLKDVCNEFLKPVPKPVLQPFWGPAAIAGNADMAAICNTLIDLQELRHIADYDLQSPIRKSDALGACDDVAVAMTAWSNLRQNNLQAISLFALAVLLWPGLANR